MRSNYGTFLRDAVLLAAIFLLAAGFSFAQSVTLTAQRTTATLPDGNTVPMWGYGCTAVAPAACTAGSTATLWAPPIITVPTGATLTVTLVNGLPVPTSLMIVGQLGGGLGAPTKVPSPSHNDLTATWPIIGGPTFKPPPQPDRVQSFGTEVPAGTSNTSLTWTAMQAGTFLLESGTHPSIQGPMGLYGAVVVTDTSVAPFHAYANVTYDADAVFLLSEIDPVQNASVDQFLQTVASCPANTGTCTGTVSTADELRVWSGQPNQCGNPSSATYHTCYPPAVDYSPLYYLINGKSFDKSNPTVLTVPAAASTGNVLLRFVNAGLRMHIPSVVGLNMSLVAEDGNALPGLPKVQNEAFLAAGKTQDVIVNPAFASGSYNPAAFAIYDRQLSLSTNNQRDGGMQAYLQVNGGALPAAVTNTGFGGTSTAGNAVANNDQYYLIPGQALIVADPAKGVIANDTNVYGVKVATAPGGSGSTLTLLPDGTFMYVPGAGITSDSFTYQANGTGPTATVTLSECTVANSCLEANTGITLNNDSYTSNVATFLSIKPPGILANDVDGAGYPLTVDTTTAPVISGPGTATLSVDPNGSFNVKNVSTPGTYTFTYQARNSQGTLSAGTATVSLTFPTPSNLSVTLIDGQTKQALSPQDYRWIIEEDRTFYVDPDCQTNPLPANCPTVTASGTPAIFGTNFHTSYMPVVAQGCTGTTSCESGQSLLGVPAVCDGGNGECRTDASQKTPVLPGEVYLDPTKHYYISVLPGDAADPGHDMGGAAIAPACKPIPPATTCTGTFAAVNVIVEPQLQQAAKLAVFVFEDDHPLNGEHDAGGGVDVISPNEAGLGEFNITILDLVGGSGDPAGQMTYDEFGQPLSNSLAGTIDPVTGIDACPISAISRIGVNDPTQKGITGMIPVCPKYEADGTTLSPLAGQAIVLNVPPGRYGVVATPGADRIARGEEWLQTNTLDGGKDHEAFIRVNEPAYFQEFGPASFHVSIGFANPKWINDQGYILCNGPGAPACTQTVTGKVTGARMSRTPDERLYESGTRDTFGYTQCYASLGSVDGADIAFAKCKDDGTFTLTGIPEGDWRLTIFDQWNDQIVDGISTPVRLGGATNATLCLGPTTSGSICDMGNIGVHGWKNNLYTRTFIDKNGDGVSQDNEPGLALVATNIRYRDGSISNFNSTDLNGFAGFNEVFPIFNWYVMETDSTRYKGTGTHVVNDAGGPVDGSPLCGTTGYPQCGTSTLLANMANTYENFPLPASPTNLRIPGAIYCDNADCTGFSIAAPPINGGPGGSTGRIDPPSAVSYGWQSYMGQNQYLEFGKKPFNAGENGGIRGHVVYASTRPFDDPALLLQLSWEPQVPNVTINLYKVDTATDGINQTLTLVDTTQTSSFDDYAQGFRSDGVPNMNCPGQGTNDPFYNVTLLNQPSFLDWYNSQHGGPAVTPLPYNSQYKCYDGMHSWNQLLPAPYDGMYQFPSVTATNPTTGKPAGTNCKICTANTAASPTDWNYGLPMLPPGKYVVEMIVPPGYELVKEEDKNILLGDAFTAPVTQEFNGFGNIFIMPDQAEIAEFYNANNPENPTTNLGATPRHEGDTGSIEAFWPCVGSPRIVPDYMSIFPQSGQVAPFAGATRRLCDRKEVTLEDQMSVLAKFYVFTSTHVASHYTGIISDDFTSEFDPFAPAFGEKFSPANLPVSIKDFAGNETSRVYSDEFGIYNGLTFSTWSVNPPDPSGYIPQMMIMCMNDRGSGATPDQFYQPAYSQFCYEWSFMPGQTGYLDTPVIPTSAFAPNYNHPDCNYPNATPAIASVTGDVAGPWVSDSGHQLTITALGDQLVDSYAYSGPSASTPPFNQKKITRHYGFGSTAGTVALVGSDGISRPLTNVVWGDLSITGNVPTGVPACTVQQRQQYGGPPTGQPERCGELVITTADGKKSVDTVTVTIGNGGIGSNASKTPTVLATGQTIQSAIDAAAPGDLIIVPPGNYHELLLMWKPVRLQGAGAFGTTIDANTHPAGILDPWRLRVVCLFGLAPNGVPAGYDPGCAATFGDTWSYFNPTTSNPQVDRLPLEAAVGWDATQNGNLAEQLQEPTLLGAYEGAGITVLAKGVRVPNGVNPWTDGAEPGGYPAGTTLLTDNSSDCNIGAGFSSNFNCSPSRIDGLSITNSSQGGGGIFVHGWAHNLEISNNRVFNNQGTMAGGITVGQGEHPGAYLVGGTNAAPGSCQPDGNLPANTQLPYCFDRFVNVHNNSVSMNASEGDELFSATPSGAGGVAFTSGDDNYQFTNNWVCGNLSTGDGSGVSQDGFVWNGSIQHNAILFNQATNPTTPSNGGGLLIMSAPDTDPTCPGEPDADCSHAYGTVGDGTGPGLVINANLIMGNAAEAGGGGGIRFQGVNGVEVSTFPNNPERWYSISVTNNIITNNVAGWDGAGVSLQDSIGVNLINNTIVSNDSTASSGTLFGAFFAPQASAPTPCPRDAQGANIPCVPISDPQPAGLSSAGHTAEFLASLPASITCPPGHPINSTNPAVGVVNGACRAVSFPALYNDVFWQNRAFNIVVTQPTSGAQQSTVTLVPSLNQTTTGQCVTPPSALSYWDIGLRGDHGPTDHTSGFTFQPKASVLTDTTGYPGGPAGFEANTSSFSPGVVKQYCNGSKVPPEAGAGAWYQVPPGTNEGNVPVPIFNLTAGATVDEGNNWVNISWGPLSLITPTTETNPSTETMLGNYSLAAGSPAINYITSALSSTTYAAAPSDDFFGNLRKTVGDPAVDAGAVEFGAAGPGVLAVVSFSGPVPALTTTPATRTVKTGTVTVTNTGAATLVLTADATVVKTAGPAAGAFAIVTQTCLNGTNVAPGASCTISVQYTPPATGANNSSTAHIHLADTGAATLTQDGPNFNAN